MPSVAAADNVYPLFSGAPPAAPSVEDRAPSRPACGSSPGNRVPREWVEELSVLSGLAFSFDAAVATDASELVMPPVSQHENCSWEGGHCCHWPVRVNGELVGMLRTCPGPEDSDKTMLKLQHAAHILECRLQASATVRTLGRAVRRYERERDFLASIEQTLSATDDVEASCQGVLDQLQAIMHVERASILLRTPQETLRFVAGIGIAPGIMTETEIPLGSGIAGAVAEHGKTIYLDEFTDDPLVSQALSTPRDPVADPSFERTPAIDAPAVCVPIMFEDSSFGVAGVLNVTDRRHGEGFSEDDIKLLEDVAAAVAQRVLMCQMVKDIKDAEQLRRELEVAATIQEQLLPSTTPVIADHHVAGDCRPAQWIGGDYYDYFPLPNGHWAVCMFDVSGHGVPAALLMATVRSMVHTLTQFCLSPRDIADSLNKLVVYDVGDSGMFATGVYMDWDPDTGVCTYVNMGHDSPFVLRRKGHVDYLSTGGVPVGIVGNAPYSESRVIIEPGDTLVLYTDGLTEAGDGANGCKALGAGALQDILRTAVADETRVYESFNAARLVKHALDAVAERTDVIPPRDDQTLLVLHVDESRHPFAAHWRATRARPACTPDDTERSPLR